MADPTTQNGAAVAPEGMRHLRPAEPLILDLFGDLAPLRQALERAGYTQAALAETMDARRPGENIDVPVVLRRTGQPSEYHTDCRLFLLGQPVPEADVRKALAPMTLERLVAGGLLRAVPDGLQSAVKLIPYRDQYFVSDFVYPVSTEPPSSDHVLGVGPASATLAALTVRRKVARTFDLGCGAGIQSLLAGAHSGTVVGSDINCRALSFARFNARLNGVDNIEWRMGSYFEPVQTELFDLVVANPPFVISPESALMYRDGGLRGDGVSELVARGAADRLAEGGYATMLINWQHHSEEDWEQRPLQWLADAGCDVWLIRSADSSPLSYAASWLRFFEARNPVRYGQLLDEWLAYYAAAGIERLAAGALILRKRSGTKNWCRSDTTDSVDGQSQCSDTIERVFAAEDRLQQFKDEAELLEQRLLVHPAVEVEQRLVLQNGVWAGDSLDIHLREGFPFSGKADVHVLKILSRCDGQRPLRELVKHIAEGLNTSFEAVVPTCLQAIKKLIRSGMLVFADNDTAAASTASHAPNA